MSQILSYNKKTTKTTAQDWIPVTPYVDDDIKRIHDPNGGLSTNPRTAMKPYPHAGGAVGRRGRCSRRSAGGSPGAGRTCCA